MALHPVVKQGWKRLQDAGYRGFRALALSDARSQFAAGAKALTPGPQMSEIQKFAIPVEGGEVEGRLYKPVEDPVGLCVYFHGGGFVLGSIDEFDTLCRTLAFRSGCALLSVDYRLAPEHPFPTPVNDALSAIRWAANLPLAAAGLAVAGDSAGGNLAAVASLQLRKELPIRLQLLFNPATDTDFQRDSYIQYGQDYLLMASDSAYFFELYAHGHDLSDPRIAPLREPDLRGSPSAWIGVAEYDILRDEGEAYAQALQAAGTPVVIRRYEGVMHGFARGHGTVDTSDRAITEAAQALRNAFEAD